MVVQEGSDRIRVLILKTGHHTLLEPLVPGLAERGYEIVWEDIISPQQMDRVDITWLSGLNLAADRGQKIADFSRVAKEQGMKLVGYYLGDWTNLADSRKRLKAIDWSGFSLLFHPNPTLVAELQLLCPSIRGLRTAYLPRILNEAFSFRVRRKFGRRIGMWGQYGWWWKGAWWLIRSFGKLQDMTEEDWELTLWGCQEKFFRDLQPYVVEEAQDMGVRFMPRTPFGELVGWIHTLDIVANASLSEGDAKPIGEGMLTGCYPIIRNWPGTRDLFPEEYIVENEWDFVQKAIAWGEKTDEEKALLSTQAAIFAREKHSYEKVVDTIDREFRKVITNETS